MAIKKYIRYIKGKSEKEEREIEEYLALYEFLDNDVDKDFPADMDEACLTENKSAGILNEIQQKIDERRANRKSILTYSVCIIALLVSGAFFIYKENKNPQKDLLVSENSPKKIEQRNDTKTAKNIVLPDKSVVVLEPNSSVSYLPEFTANSRDVYLKGTAVFEVSKNPERPFTVYCGDVATTALGTKFRVSSFVQKTLVELFEGKVLVRNADEDNEDKQYYLEAGKAIAYNIMTNDFTPVTNIAMPSNKIKTHTVAKKIVAVAAKPNLLTFENIPMTDALDKLSDKYNVRIEYSPEDLSNINIIAAISVKQPLSQVLENIASMNDLELIVTGNEYILHRKKTKKVIPVEN